MNPRGCLGCSAIGCPWMEYAVLGATGLRVSRVGFGVYSVTGMYGEVPRGQALEVIREAFRLGINFFDTADVYGRGLGESILCEALGRDGVEEAVIATKIGYDWYSGETPPPRRYDAGFLLEAAARSAERLCKKPVDLVQIHNPPREVLESGELWEAVDRLREEGLAAHVGVALGPETDVLPHARAALSRGGARVESLQFVYNMLEQEPGYSIAVEAAGRGAGTIARVPHAGGVLDEEQLPRLRPGEIRDHRSLRRRGWYSWALQALERIKPLLGEAGLPLSRLAVRFVLDSAPVNTVVVIAREPGELRRYAAAAGDPPLPRRLMDELRRAYLELIGGSPEAPRESLRLLGYDTG